MTRTAPADTLRQGLIQGVGAYLIWGLLPLYLLPLRGVSAGEILSDRIAFSLVLVLAIIWVTKRGAALRTALTTPRTLGMLTISAILITINWLVFIWAALHHHMLAASLGYFLSPLASVLIGLAVLHERLTRLQLAAIALAAAGVAVLASSAGGDLWISLALAVSFSLYGYVRKVAPVEALEGLTVETMILTPFALAFLVWLDVTGGLVFGDQLTVTVLLAAAGVITAFPLLLFAAAARKLPLSMIGILQYLTPTGQFLLAITAFGEALSAQKLLCFALIWAGLALFVIGSLHQQRAASAV